MPFWEELYKDDSVSAFGTSPNTTILDFEHLYESHWNILDAGCGDGKNALYLSSRGFGNIDAFDLSEYAIDKLNRTAKKNAWAINAWAQDLRCFHFDKIYDLILSFGTLHFVEKPYWKAFLAKAKAHTQINGLHIIQLFTNVLPASSDIERFAVGLADDKEIQALYTDWEILQFKSYSFEDEHPGIPKHFHSSNKIVAQRKV